MAVAILGLHRGSDTPRQRCFGRKQARKILGDPAQRQRFALRHLRPSKKRFEWIDVFGTSPAGVSVDRPSVRNGHARGGGDSCVNCTARRDNRKRESDGAASPASSEGKVYRRS